MAIESKKRQRIVKPESRDLRNNLDKRFTDTVQEFSKDLINISIPDFLLKLAEVLQVIAELIEQGISVKTKKRIISFLLSVVNRMYKMSMKK